MGQNDSIESVTKEEEGEKGKRRKWARGHISYMDNQALNYPD